jgi:hypothetical protein
MAQKKPRYPFKNMSVGESFKINKDIQQVRNAVAAFTKDSEPEWVFSIKNVDGKYICIRLK